MQNENSPKIQDYAISYTWTNYRRDTKKIVYVLLTANYFALFKRFNWNVHFCDESEVLHTAMMALFFEDCDKQEPVAGLYKTWLC